MKKELHFKSNKHKLFGIYQPANCNGIIALLLHGLTNSHNTCPLINEANDMFIQNGISTFRFDYFGSGKSEGFFVDKTIEEMIINTKDAYRYAVNNLRAKKIIVWGRSFGAIFTPLISIHKHVIASVLISSTTHTHISMRECFSANQISKPFKATGLIKGEPILPYSFYLETAHLDSIVEKGLRKTKNLLVIQGTNDKTVYDMSWADEIYQLALEPKKLIYMKEADHTYRGFEKQILDVSLDWIIDKLEDIVS